MTEVVCCSIEVVVFRLNGDRGEYLILRRSLQEPAHPGMWQIVTGMVEEGETAVEAGLREVREETGLSAVRLWNVPRVNSFYNATRDTVNMCPVFAIQTDPGAGIVLSEEHMAFDWLPLAAARERLVWPAHRDSLDIVDSYIVRGSEAADRLQLPVP
jgi:dATP pyrophosphohydrolase